jgi:hypothetical protein
MSATEQTVRHLLRDVRGESLCAGCLALACEATLTATRQCIETLLEDQEQFRCGVACAGCGRTVLTIAYYPLSNGRSRCSDPAST